jgi:hypothetical protein
MTIDAEQYSLVVLVVSTVMFISTLAAVWACVRKPGRYESHMALALLLSIGALFLAAIRNLDIIVAGTGETSIDAFYRVLLLGLRCAIVLVTVAVVWSYARDRDDE